jgi:hypothetical protein
MDTVNDVKAIAGQVRNCFDRREIAGASGVCQISYVIGKREPAADSSHDSFAMARVPSGYPAA